MLFTSILIYSSAQTNLNFIGSRLLHPLYPLFILFIGIGPAQMRKTITNHKTRTVISFAVAIALLTAAGTNSIALSKDFFNISKVARGTNRITEVGFERNPNAMEMARHFHAALDNHTRIVAIHIDNIKHDPRSYYGYGFFSRSVMWDSPLISDIRIHNVLPPLDNRIREGELCTYHFDVSLNYKNLRRQVFYRGLPRPGDMNAVADALGKQLEENNSSCAFTVESYVAIWAFSVDVRFRKTNSPT